MLSLLTLVAAAALIAGCGGGKAAHTVASDGTAPAKGASSALSLSQLIAQADAVCHRLNDAIATTQIKTASAQEIALIVPRHVSLERGTQKQLEQLVPPPSFASKWQRILGYRRGLADELAELVTASQHADNAKIATLSASKKSAHAALLKAAKSYGFKDCSVVG